MADRFDLDAIAADDALLDLLAAGGESAHRAGAHDPALLLLAELRLAVEVEDELPVETIDDPENFLARCAAINPVTDPLARKLAARGLALGVAAVAALSVSGVAAAVTGDPLSPYEKVIEKMVDAVRPEASFPADELNGMPVVDKTKIVKVAKNYREKQKQQADADRTVTDPKDLIAVPAADLDLKGDPRPPLARPTPSADKPGTSTVADPTGDDPADATDVAGPGDVPTTAPDDDTEKGPSTEPSPDPTPANPDTPGPDVTPSPEPTPTDPPSVPPTGTMGPDGNNQPSPAPTTDSTGPNEASGGHQPGSTEQPNGSGNGTTGTGTPDSGGTDTVPGDTKDAPADDKPSVVVPTTPAVVPSTPAVPNPQFDGPAGDATADPARFTERQVSAGESLVRRPTSRDSDAGQDEERKIAPRHSSGRHQIGAPDAKFSAGKHSSGRYTEAKHSSGRYAEGRHAAIDRAHGTVESGTVLRILGVINGAMVAR